MSETKQQLPKAGQLGTFCPSEHPGKRHHDVTAGGFTLVEVLAATLIGALVVIVALVALRNVAKTRERVERYSELNANGRYARGRFRDDLANVYRGGMGQMRFEGTKKGGNSRLVFYAACDAVGRRSEETADVCELEYALTTSRTSGRSFLGRRCGLVRNLEDGNRAGMLTQIAEHVRELELAYFNGTVWLQEWAPSQRLPSMVRVGLKLSDVAANEASIRLSQVISLEPRGGRELGRWGAVDSE